MDLRLGDGNGLDVIESIRQRRNDTKIVVLTGYGNIATAVTPFKLGALDYLAKPADADDVFKLLTQRPGEKRPKFPKTRCQPTGSLGAYPKGL